MKYCVFLLVLGFTLFGFGLLIGSTNPSQEITYQIVHVIGEKQETERKIEETDDDKSYKIEAYLPYTPYPVLNNAIDSLASSYISDFKKEIQEYGILTHQVYSLQITYDVYSYQNFVSYVFWIFMDIAGAHPNTFIRTITFDKKRQEIVTIDSLVDKYPNILNEFSKISLEELKKSEKFNENGYDDILGMLESGTRPVLENFKSFAFSEDGLILFFENYQVAPYFYGSFQVKIPYSKLDFLDFS